MKFLIPTLIMIASLAASANQRATPAQKKLICNKMLAEKVIRPYQLSQCIGEYDAFVQKPAPGTTVIEVNYVQSQSFGGSTITICELKYKGSAERAIVGRRALKCRTH